MAKSRIAIIVGSSSRDLINRKLARALAKLGADKFDASFIRIDDLPMFNQDLEGNLPEDTKLGGHSERPQIQDRPISGLSRS